MTPAVADDTAALWLHAFQRAVARASHDVKDALNGVSVNVEVVRSRAARPDTPAAAVLQFSNAAGQQLDRLSTLIDAILSLARAEREPVDVAAVLRRMTILCGASSSPADAHVRLIKGDYTGAVVTSARGDVVRLALVAPLLDLVRGENRAHPASEVQCALSGTADGILVEISAAGRRAVMPESIADIVRAAGIRCTEGDQGLSLAFPHA
ncbi:MAG: hypothetical protein V4550_04820 [Gemmatimonadota bacterium]